ncbi:MAG: hypothetical protein EGR74_10540 [Ruminiclostridium sp.]|nr:hypothetical protein [Ruminiclostridium sp.]MBE5717418.1 hypothetical protein [Ruminiclostridium sp.]
MGHSPKRGEGGSPTLSPFPRGRGLGLGMENLLYLYKNILFLQTKSRFSAARYVLLLEILNQLGKAL